MIRSVLVLVTLVAWGCGDGKHTSVGSDEATPTGALQAVFPDGGLVVAVAAAVGDVDAAGVTAWMDTATTLNARDRGIASLKGIGRLLQLRVLDLADNNIVDVAALASLDSLRFLDLTGNRVEELAPLAGLGRLQVLLLAGNQVVDLTPVLGLDSLTSLELTGNPLASEALARTESLTVRGVQVTFEGEPAPTPVPEAPDQGAMTFAFGGISPIGSRFNIWLGFTDGTPPRPLIEENASFGDFYWSPDGGRGVFSSNRDDALRQFSKIYVVNADGSGLEAVSDWSVGAPGGWSPDGTHIAVVRQSNTSSDLYVMATDTWSLMQLTDPAEAMDGTDADLSWSPDGTRIAFKRTTGSEFVLVRGAGRTIWDHPDSLGLLIVDVGTGQVRRLVDGPLSSVSWSPTGSRILYAGSAAADPTSPIGDIFVVDADAGAVTNLTADAASDSEPAWSPDGSRIVFVSTRDSPGETLGDIFVMHADGSGIRRVTESDASYMSPSWSPDGQVIAYISDRGGVWSISLTDEFGQFHFNVTAQLVEILPHFSARIRWRPR